MNRFVYQFNVEAGYDMGWSPWFVIEANAPESLVAQCMSTAFNTWIDPDKAAIDVVRGCCPASWIITEAKFVFPS